MLGGVDELMLHTSSSETIVYRADDNTLHVIEGDHLARFVVAQGEAAVEISLNDKGRRM